MSRIKELKKELEKEKRKKREEQEEADLQAELRAIKLQNKPVVKALNRLGGFMRDVGAELKQMPVVQMSMEEETTPKKKKKK